MIDKFVEAQAGVLCFMPKAGMAQYIRYIDIDIDIHESLDFP